MEYHSEKRFYAINIRALTQYRWNGIPLREAFLRYKYTSYECCSYDMYYVYIPTIAHIHRTHFFRFLKKNIFFGGGGGDVKISYTYSGCQKIIGTASSLPQHASLPWNVNFAALCRTAVPFLGPIHSNSEVVCLKNGTAVLLRGSLSRSPQRPEDQN